MLLGLGMSLVAGVLFGACFNPAQLVQDHAAKHYCNAFLSQHQCETFHQWEGGHDGTIGLHWYCDWDGSADDGKKCGGPPTTDMAFSQFLGIFLTSFTYFVVYAAYKWYKWSQEHPGKDIADSFVGGPQGFMFVNVPLILPGILCGIIWAMAQIGWFIANQNLSMTVAFPIVCATPAIIGNAWGFFVFDEVVRTPKNIGLLCFGMCLSVAAGTLTALSK